MKDKEAMQNLILNQIQKEPDQENKILYVRILNELDHLEELTELYDEQTEVCSSLFKRIKELEAGKEDK